VGCTGQTVYIYNNSGEELAKFKDLKYAYSPAISPDEKRLFVKSTVGKLAVYSLDSLSLIKKFRLSKVNGAQDDGYCFSNDSKYFINVEKVLDELHSAVSWYDTETLDKMYFLKMDSNIGINEIECSDNGDLYVLGFYRNTLKNFVAIINETGILKLQEITELEGDFYLTYMRLMRSGFTEKSWNWVWFQSGFDFEKIKSGKYSLEKLFNYYNDK